MNGCAATGASTTSRSERPGESALEVPLRRLLADGQPVAVAYSAGLDSSVLIHAVARIARVMGSAVHALHVHHGLSPHADRWLAHGRARCVALGVDFHAARVELDAGTGEGVEAQARRLRYAALARLAREAGCGRVLLAHHQDDQAETVLLQALRGAGLDGLAAMPERLERAGLVWWRPWLRLPRAALSAYAAQHALAYVDDESNLDPRYARNRLRHQVLPLLAGGFPGAADALVQVATQAQEAKACLAELAALDLASLRLDGGLDLTRWHGLSMPRRSNALRAWLREVLGQPAPRSLVLRLMAQLRPGLAPRRWPAPQGVVALYRDVLSWAPAAAVTAPKPLDASAAPSGAVWRIEGPGWYGAPLLGGGLLVELTAGQGVPLARLKHLHWHRRHGGEQFQRHAGGVPRSLKKVFQEAGVPAWARGGPLLYADGQLLLVPGLGVDARWLASSGERLVTLEWRSDNVAGGSVRDEVVQAGKI